VAPNDRPGHLHKPSLLVVSQQPDTLSEIAALAGPDFEVHTADSSGAALQALACAAFDLLLADQALRPMTGCQVLAWVQEHSPRSIRLLLVGSDEVGQGAEALGQGLADGCALRPLRPDRLLSVLRGDSHGALYRHRRAPALEAFRHRGFNLQRTLLLQWRLLEQAAQRLARQEARLEKELRRLRRQVLELECQAMTDALTGLLNRQGIEGVAEYEVGRHARYPAPLALGLIDADHFKEINSLHLIPGGDQALTCLARALTGALRAADRVGRVGGEEFLVVAPQTDLAGAKALAERLRTTVEQTPIHYEGKAIALTISVGFAVAEAGMRADVVALQHVAALALNEAKNAGRNCSVVRKLEAPVQQAS
jgi:diguanylate cyclase (GGDEF)-like protein